MAAFSLILQTGESEPRELLFDKEEVTIGRLPTDDITLNKSNVSKQHARIVVREGKHFIIDRKSTNGTFVNGKRISAPVSLKAGDKIFVGDYSMTFLLPEAKGVVKDSAAPVPPPLPVKEVILEAGFDMEKDLGLLDEKPVPTPPPLSLFEEPEAVTAEPEASPEAEVDALFADSEVLIDEEEDEFEMNEFSEQTIHWRGELYEEALGFEEFGDYDHFLEYHLDDDEFSEKISAKLSELVDKTVPADIAVDLKQKIHETVLEELLGYGSLEQYLFDDDVEEISVNGPGQIIIHENGDKEIVSDQFSSERALFNILARLVASAGIPFDGSEPMIDLKLPEGYSISAVMFPYSAYGTSLHIVKPSRVDTNPVSMKEAACLNDDMSQLLDKAIHENKNIMVVASDERDSLTALSLLSHYIPDEDRLLLLDTGADVAADKPDTVVLDTTVAQVLEDEWGMTAGEMIHQAYKLRPRRLVVHNVGEDSALELLYALNAEFRGSLFSVRGASLEDALRSMELMAGLYDGESGRQAAIELIGSVVDMIVQIKRFEDGSIRISNIANVNETDDGFEVNSVFFWDEEKKEFSRI